MALPSLKNIGIQIPNYAKPNLDTDLKLEKAPEKKVLGSRFLGKVEEGLQKVLKPIQEAVRPYSVKTERERLAESPIDEQSQIDASFGLAVKKKMGNQLTPEEETLFKEGQKTFAKKARDLVMGFMGTADMNIVKQLTPVQKVIGALKEAKPLRKLQETIYSAERGVKIAKSKAIGTKTSGEAGFYSELGALKGEIPKVQFESLRATSQIDDTLQPLAQEARKYKSAEEFIAAQKNIVKESLIKDIEYAKELHLKKIRSGEKIPFRGGVKAQFGVVGQKNIVLDALKGKTEKIGEAQRILARWIKRHEKLPIIHRGIEIVPGKRTGWDNRWINTYEDTQKFLSGKTDFKRLSIKSQLTDFYNQVMKTTTEQASKLSQLDIDDIFNQVKNSPLLNDWDKITARQSLVKLFGKAGGTVPTEGELTLLNRVFPKEFTNALLSKKPFVDKLKDTIFQITNIPRSVMASYDLSAPFRQGAFLLPKQAITHPIRTFKTFVNMFKQFGSEKAFNGLQESIIRRPTFKLMQEAKLALSQMDDILSLREEKFMSSWAEKIPGVRASGRAYTGFLNKLRADVFDDLVKSAENLGLNPSKNIDLLREIGNFINLGSGRGSLGKLQGAANALNTFFFSPRLMSSRLTLLNPAYYVKADHFVRKEALKSLLTFAGTGLTILGLAKANGLDVGTDPRSSDFLKIKIGNTRIDIGAGFQQYLRIAGQLISGQYVSSTTGKVITLGEGYKPLTRYDILFRQIESKEAPLFAFATDLLRGQDFAGRELDLKSEVAQLFIPMVMQSVYDIMKDDPSLLPLSVFGFFGVGLQTYQGKTDIKGGPSLKGGGLKMPSLKGAGMVK